MRVMKCDACQATYEPYDGFEESGNANGLLTVNFDRKGHYDKRDYIDLCPDCARKLHLFLHGNQDLAHIKAPIQESDEYEQEVEE